MWCLVPPSKYSSLNTKLRYNGFPSYEQALETLTYDLEDFKEALQCFLDVLAGHGNPKGLTNFDAHVGDTNCQIRAFMVCVLHNTFKPPTRFEALKEFYNNVQSKVESLKAIHQKLSIDRKVYFMHVLS
jgi:hypothetical protein